jgi:hypothetical protein
MYESQYKIITTVDCWLLVEWKTEYRYLCRQLPISAHKTELRTKSIRDTGP